MNIPEIRTAIRRYATLILQRLSGKVDKVDGKQLSTEDFTTENKEKLDGVKSMAMRDLHVSTQQPDNAVGNDGDIWLTIQPPQQ
ncbi:hypothetical protein D3C73_173650 [compost metagenome]|jgi:hypothetical protein